jgi:acetaldehyde dehydrogenase/alcohol dehydrogenase
MPSPNVRSYKAHKKYSWIADLLGLGGDTVEDKVKSLIGVVEDLLDRLEVPRSIAEMGITEEEFKEAMPDLVKAAFDDPSWRSNPRMPLLKELEKLFWQAYRGRGQEQEQRQAPAKRARSSRKKSS